MAKTKKIVRGYFGIGIYHVKHEVNIGTLWRSAYQLGASFVFTIGRRYSSQASDTTKTWKHVPLFHFSNFDDFINHSPYSAPIIAVGDWGRGLPGFTHPERCIYLLGAEDHGLPDEIVIRCHECLSIPATNMEIYNVSVAGSIVMYDRMAKSLK